jgi:hypothetical protein
MQGIAHRNGGGGGGGGGGWVDCWDLNKRKEVQNEKETFNLCEYKMRNDTKLRIWTGNE